MSDIGPFGKVSFNNNASIGNDAGDTVIKSGTDGQLGHTLTLGLDGALKLDGKALLTQDALDGYVPQGLATEQYVRDTVPSLIEQIFKGAQSLKVPGYVKLPGGLILQWGIVTVSGGLGFTWTYPTPFPNGVFVALGNAIAGSTANTADRTVQPVAPGNTSCSFSSTYNGGQMPGPTAHMVFAVGY